MTRIPTFIQGAGGSSAGQVGTGSSQIALPAPARTQRVPSGLAVAGQAIAATLEQMGRRRIQAQRARTLTQTSSNGIVAVQRAFQDSIKLDPSVMEKAFNEHPALAEWKEQIEGIEDRIVGEEANDIFTEQTSRGLRSVIVAAGRGEASKGRTATVGLKENLRGEVRDGTKDPLVAIAELQERIADHLDGAYTEEMAKDFLDSALVEFYRERVDLLLNGTDTIPPSPGSVEAFLEREDVQKIMSAAERRRLKAVAERAIDNENEERIIGRLSIAEETLDHALAIDGVNTEDFKTLANKVASEVTGLPGFTGTADDVVLSILAKPLEAAARLGDVERFDIIANSLPIANSDAEILFAKGRNLLLSAVNRTNAQDLIDARVQDARMHGLALEKNTSNKDAVNQAAQKEIEALREQNPDIGTEGLALELISNWGPTTLLPQQITRVPSAIARNPSAFGTQEVQTAFDIMTFARNAHPRSYEQSFDPDVRKFHKLFIRMMAPGANAQEIAGFAHEALNPTDVAKAAALNSVMDSLVTGAMSAFVDFAKEDPNFDIALEGDFELNRLFNVEQEGIPIFRTDVFNDIVPPDMTQRYIDFFQVNMNRGMTKEAAQIDAWERITDAGYGVTTAFQEEPVIRKLAPERIYGGTGDEIALDLANRIGLDAFDGKIEWPDVMIEEGEEPFPRVITTDELRRRAGRSRARGPTGLSIGIAPTPTAPPPTIDMDIGEPNLFRAMQKDNLARILEFATSRLDIIPVGNEDQGLAIMGPDGKRMPLYQLVYIDSEGRPHPVMTTARNPITGEQEPETYKLAPIRSNGLSHAREVQRRNLVVQKALREMARRAEAVAGHREAVARSQELEILKRPRP